MAHTPGPWHTETRNTVTAICCKPTRPGEWPDICFQERDGHPEHGSITGRMRTTEELAANARLIAAAPELLAACEALLDVQSSRRHPLGSPDEGIATAAAEAASKARAAITKATEEG